jgi:hypothetical protein
MQTATTAKSSVNSHYHRVTEIILLYGVNKDYHLPDLGEGEGRQHHCCTTYSNLRSNGITGTRRRMLNSKPYISTCL